MKLLLDQNLSPRLVYRFADLYPDAAHVSQVGLDRADDLTVWAHARAHGYAIVSKGSDFADVSVLRGVPPKLIWLRLGNCTTGDVERALRRAHQAIVDFVHDPAAGVLELI